MTTLTSHTRNKSTGLTSSLKISEVFVQSSLQSKPKKERRRNNIMYAKEFCVLRFHAVAKERSPPSVPGLSTHKDTDFCCANKFDLIARGSSCHVGPSSHAKSLPISHLISAAVCTKYSSEKACIRLKERSLVEARCRYVAATAGHAVQNSTKPGTAFQHLDTFTVVLHTLNTAGVS